MTTNEYRVILTDHLHPVKTHVCPDESGEPVAIHKGSLNGLMGVKIISILYPL